MKWKPSLAHLCALLALSSTCQAEEILFEMHNSEPAVMEIQADETLETLSTRLAAHFDVPMQEQLLFVVPENERGLIYHLVRLDQVLPNPMLAKTSQRLDPPPAVGRDYYRPHSAEDLKTLTWLIYALANYSYPKLLIQKWEIEKAGDRIDHLHPLRHILLIFTNEQIKVNAANLRQRGLIWNQYIDGLGDTLTEEFLRDNITEAHIVHFAQTLNLSPAVVRSAIQQMQWEQLFDILIQTLPRQGNPRRYNQ